MGSDPSDAPWVSLGGPVYGAEEISGVMEILERRRRLRMGLQVHEDRSLFF